MSERPSSKWPSPRTCSGLDVCRRPGTTGLQSEIALFHRQTEVGEIGFLCFIQQDVTRLHITVRNAAPVRVVESFGQTTNEFGGLNPSQPAFAQAGMERRPIDVLGRDVAVSVVGLACVVYRHDVGMIEAGQHAGFRQIDADLIARTDVAAVGDLDGHVAMQLLIVGEIDRAEAAPSETLDDAVAADLTSSGEHGRTGVAIGRLELPFNRVGIVRRLIHAVTAHPHPVARRP